MYKVIYRGQVRDAGIRLVSFEEQQLNKNKNRIFKGQTTLCARFDGKKIARLRRGFDNEKRF